MKIVLTPILSLLLLLSCQDKKLTEVVEVPLPAAEEKITIGHPDDVAANPGAFSMYKLPYEYDALAPHIDAMTMENHYARHYFSYTNNLNSVLEGTDMARIPIDMIFKRLDMSNADLRNNLGGYYNHTLFFETLSPKAVPTPQGKLATAIDAQFGSFERMSESLKNAALRQFGSGWAWLVVTPSGKLEICATPNQDNPLMPQMPVKGTPIAGIDIWEHAYYLGYQYRRGKYVEAIFNVLDWNKIGEKYEAALPKAL